MENKIRSFEISNQENLLLNNHQTDSKMFLQIISQIRKKNEKKFLIDLKPAEAEFLHEYLLDQIVETGFEENYELNKNGTLLENITDRLFKKFLNT